LLQDRFTNEAATLKKKEERRKKKEERRKKKEKRLIDLFGSFSKAVLILSA
jgi:hypothetical protein